jgi:alpha-tubulin suppressor-like RCC1 family protein
VIIDMGETYVLVLPSHNPTSLDYFDRVVTSFRVIDQNTATHSIHTKGIPAGAKLAAGAGHTCLVTLDETLKCWGHNGFGQLGNGASPLIPLENAPVVEGIELSDWGMAEVNELQDDILAITAGAYHTCVLTKEGGVKCWGQNAYGQLGDGTVIDRDRPVDVQGLTTGVAAITAGAAHTCALMENGGVKCWGQNNGLLGNGKTADSLTPVDVIDLSGNITQIHAGWVFTCALTIDGDLFCWGDGSYGRFGDGSSLIYAEPIKVDGLPDEVKTLAAGQYHLCASLKTNEVGCWGALSSEQEYTSLQPFVVSGLSSEIVKLVAGGGHTCGLTIDGGVKCWGDNYFGQLGDGTNLPSFIPVDVDGCTSGVVEIASGGGHVCALMADGKVKCWGDGSAGQLGDSRLAWK